MKAEMNEAEWARPEGAMPNDRYRLLAEEGDQVELLLRWDEGSEGTYVAGREDDRRAGGSQKRHLLPAPSGQHDTEPVALRLSTALSYVQNPHQAASGTG
jgi:hypothetical protein